MIKTSVILFILLYLTSAYSAQTVDKLNSNQLKLPQESISRALILDATGQIKSSSTVSDTELSYLDGLTDTLSNLLSGKESTITSGTVSQYYRGDKTFQTLDKTAVGLGSVDNTSDLGKPISTATQTALNLKLSTTGDESASGIKTFTGQTVASSTTIGFIPCPAMTDAQMNAIASPQNGSCVYNTTNAAQYVYSTTSSTWKVNGGGGTGGISAWVTAKSYIIDDVVIESNKIYKCLIAHTSGTFSTDLAAVKWQIVSGTTVEIGSVLPMANGGTNKIATASDGAIAYSDTDSFELLAPGTSGQILQTNGAAAPSFVNKSISAKAQNASSVTAEEIQFPNNLLTETATNKHLNETGNTNILSNPSFEHSTFSTSWTNSAGTFTQETSVVIGGKASAKLVLSAQTMSLTQSSTLYAAQFADGVQGLAMVRIKSGIALKVCSIQAGTVSTTNCVTTATDSKWGLYKIPFILGGTSNGISIASSGSVTGTVYIDDAFVGAAAILQDVDQSRIAGESYFAGTTNCGSWSRTSTTIGALGTDADCPGPTIVRSSMGTWATTDSNLPRQTITNLPAGTYKASFYVSTNMGAANVAAFAINDGTTTCEAVPASSPVTSVGSSVVSCTFNYTSAGDRVFELYAGSNASTIVVDNSITTPRISTKFILEYFGSNQTYSSQCGSNCVDVFSALVTDGSGTTVVTQENSDFINGNCTNSGTGIYACTFNTGIFTVAPNCFAQTNIGQQVPYVSSTSSIVSITNRNDAGTLTDTTFFLSCQKQGADFVATRTIQGTFNEVMVATGVTKPKTCYYAFGGAAATLASPVVCSTGTCVEVFDSCGTGSPPAFSSTGAYTNTTFASGTFANNSFVQCGCVSYASSTNGQLDCLPYWLTGGLGWAANSSGGFVISNYSALPSGAATNSYIALRCEGSAP